MAAHWPPLVLAAVLPSTASTAEAAAVLRRDCQLWKVERRIDDARRVGNPFNRAVYDRCMALSNAFGISAPKAGPASCGAETRFQRVNNG
jgi:hypothetical protein